MYQQPLKKVNDAVTTRVSGCMWAWVRTDAAEASLNRLSQSVRWLAGWLAALLNCHKKMPNAECGQRDIASILRYLEDVK